METDNTIKIDSSCCKMKTVKGYCPKPLESASGFLSKKWAISVIITIGNFKRLRFNDLRDKIENITAKTLTERLKELEKEKIVSRQFYHEIPPRVEYSLTNKGQALMHSLLPMIHWAEHRNK